MHIRGLVYGSGCAGVVFVRQHHLLRLKKALKHTSFELSKYQQAAMALCGRSVRRLVEDEMGAVDRLLSGVD